MNTPHDKLKKREQNLKTRYGMEIADFVERVERQRNRCEICKNLTKKFVVDHCHERNKVRDLLCGRCNNLLGLAEDNIDLLNAATDYLVKHS
jgi:cupin superfamily acireductone dioxygenase involved in methionine salvage